jgi:hypothetical protein
MPQAQMLEDLIDDIFIFNKGDHSHPYRLQRLKKSDLKLIETWPGDTITCGR